MTARPKLISDALGAGGIRQHSILLDPRILFGPIVFSGVLPDNGATNVDLTLGETTSGAPLRPEDWDIQFPSSNGVKPKVLMYCDELSMDIGQGDGTNGISPANWEAITALGGPRLHWARGNDHRRFELVHFANLSTGQAISDTNATTANLRLVPRQERRVYTIPGGHLEVDFETDTFEIEIPAAINFTGTFTPPFKLFMGAVAIAKKAVPGWTPGPNCNRLSSTGARARRDAQLTKQLGRDIVQIPRR